MKKSTRNKFFIILLIAASVILISLFFIDRGMQLTYNEGENWNYPRLMAPFDVPIEHDSISKLAIHDSIMERFVPFYRIDDNIAITQVNRLEAALTEMDNVTAHTRVKIINMAQNVYKDGIVDNATADLISMGKLPAVRILEGNEAISLETAALRSGRDAYYYIDTTLTAPEEQAAMDAVKLDKFLVPTVLEDTMESQKYFNQEYRAAIVPHGVVSAGEEIIDYGDQITPQKYIIIKTYEEMMSERSMSATDRLVAMLGKAFVVALLMLVFYLFMRIMRPAIFSHFKKMVLLVMSILVFVILVYLTTKYRAELIYVIPFALVPIIITTFTDSRTGFFVHLIVVLICSLVAAEQAEFIILQFLAGVIAIISVRELSQRSQLVKGAVYIFLAYSLTYIAILVARQGAINHLDWSTFLMFAINCTVLSFAYFGIFIIEKLFGFTSLVTMVELSDINNPVLRELSQTCPGTFQHSLQVANLAGEAAHEIGANSQLARVGALYHDIGKMENPAFFTENQKGVNPHDALQPSQSASIVIAHVTDGLKRAEKAGLPQVVKDFISQHHGKGRAKYFYAAACKQRPDEHVDPAAYTYPGPNPKSKETAIVMMADACEAACKSLVAPDVKGITALVGKVIDGQMADGLFREAPITYADVQTVRQFLIDRLCTMFQTRVSYPDDVKPEVVQESGIDPEAEPES